MWNAKIFSADWIVEWDFIFSRGGLWNRNNNPKIPSVMEWDFLGTLCDAKDSGAFALIEEGNRKTATTGTRQGQHHAKDHKLFANDASAFRIDDVGSNSSTNTIVYLARFNTNVCKNA